MRILYNTAIRTLGFGIYLGAALQNKKAKEWLLGRENWERKMATFSNEKIIWLHVSSLGEYIMSKPLIEQLLDSYKDNKILLTFFSPSGYLNTKIQNQRIVKHYIPLDTNSNAKKFVQLVNPQIALFSKYDFWFNFLVELQRKKIPTLVFSANLRPEQIYFKNAFKWQMKILQKFSKILVLNTEIQKFLKSKNFSNVIVSGDVRFDEVGNKKEHDLSKIIEFIDGKKCIVLGSCWEHEENILFELGNSVKDYALILAPHDISKARLSSIESKFYNKTVRFSKLEKLNHNNPILIVDEIGLLAEIYRLSDIAFIGGGFTGKLHNILEAAATKNVVVFGNNFKDYPEAMELISTNGAFSIQNYKDFLDLIQKTSDEKVMNLYKNKAVEFVHRNKGATKIVMEEINKLI